MHPGEAPIPTSGKMPKGVNYEHMIIMDQRMSILDLKAKISKHLGISLANLIFLRGGSHGNEIKEDELSLKAASLYNNVSIFVKRGVPSKKDEKRLKFILASHIV